MAQQQSPYEILEQQRALVAQLRARFDKARTELEQAQMALQGMERIVEALPTRRRSASIHADVKPDIARQVGSAGRQPGAISMRWRAILNALHRDGKPFPPVRVAEVVKELEGRVMKPSEAKRILEGYVEHGYVQKAGWSDYQVTEDAAKRFDFQGTDDLEALFNAANIATDRREPNPILDDKPPAAPVPSSPEAWGQQPLPRGEQE